MGSGVALAVDADADVAGFEVAEAEDEHGVDLLLLGVLDLAFHIVGGDVEFGADAVLAQFGVDAFGVVDEFVFGADGEDADLLGGEPEGEIPRMYEFVPAASSKAHGVAFVADRLGIDRSQTLAFGDSYNDIPLFQWAGHSVAMAHGCDAAKTAASETSPAAPSNSALAASIEQLQTR